MRFLFAGLYLLAVALLAHPVGEALPRVWFRPELFPFRCGAWETTLYRALRVAKWKDRVPDMSKHLTDMQPKKITSVSLEQMDILLRETCVAESVHWVELLLGGGCIAIAPGIGGLLWAVWALMGNLPFILIQRYNRPRLIKLRERLAVKQERRNV